MTAQPITRVRLTIPAGILALCDQAAKRIKGGSVVWESGLREVVEKALEECGIPPELTAVEAARHFGILKKDGSYRRLIRNLRTADERRKAKC